MTDNNVSRRSVLAGVGANVAAAPIVGIMGNGDWAEVLVGVNGRQAAASVAQKADEHVKTIDLGHVRQVVHGTFPSQAIEALQNNPAVEYVEENSTYHALGQTLPWGIDRVDADVVHEKGATGNGVDIAIIDTGIDDDHPDLQANVGAGKAFVECSGSNCNHPWSDDNYHGTHVAGIADAVDNSTGVIGVSTDATLHAVKVLNRSGNGSLSDIADGVRYVADQNWDVASMSLGEALGDQTLEDACRYAYDNGVLLVSATGNVDCSDCVSYPAAYETVIAVSATDEDDSLWEFSSTGPETELAAPGVSVYSTVIGGYDTDSGTSMACPHVSGAGAQLMANGYTNTEARSRLQTTAEDIGLGANEQGHGLLDAEAAICLEVDIDIKPGSDVNPIHLDNRGVITVAILHTTDFNPVDRVDVESLRFGDPANIDNGDGAAPAHDGHVEDVDSDGNDDLVLHFPTQDTGFEGDEEVGKLVGKTTDRKPLFGTDSVTFVDRGRGN